MSVQGSILGRMGSKIPPSLQRIAAEQAGVISRQQVLRAGVPRSTIISKIKHGLWQQLHPGVYGAFTGEISREARLWAAVLCAGPGALLSHETAAEILGLTDRRCPVIQVTVPASRRVRPPQGVAIHYSSFDHPRWRPLRGVPPHTFYAETIIDLVAVADNLDDVVAWVSRGIARNLVSEAQLKAAVAARRRFRWRDQIGEVIERVAGGSHFRSNSATTATSSVPTGSLRPRGRRSLSSRTGLGDSATAATTSTASSWSSTARSSTQRSSADGTGPATTRPPQRPVRPSDTAGPM